jgi:myo-inositol 2-dehydrogenase/D-chiro-inositol 1-dehydrogenase
VNVGFVGVGAVAQHHLSVIAKRDDISVVAVCDLDERRARNVADATGATAYDDWRSMLDGEELETVFVCTPPEAHAEPTVAALRAGIPVYVEKPLARVFGDGLAIVSAWEGSGVVCAVGYQWRSLDLLSDVLAALNGASPGLLISRSIGATEPSRADLAAPDPLAGDRWFADPERGGGILFELGSHDIDLQLAIAGPVESVQAAAAGGLLALAGRPATGLQDAVTAALRFSSGGLGTIQVAWTDAQEPPLYTLDVMAAKASLHVELDPVFRLDGRTEAGVVSVVGKTHPRESTLTQFFDAVSRGDRGAVACSPSDALSTLRVALACEQAIATGDCIALAEVP